MRTSRLKLSLIIILLAFICSSTACVHIDKPPDDGSPWPENLNGVYLSDFGKLSFNGDGTSVTFELTEDFADLICMPSEQIDGTYVFLFGNKSWRYDKAESFRLDCNEASFSFQNDFTKTCFERIVLTIPGAASESIVFERSR